MLISHDLDETRVAVVEDRGLVEYYIERAKRSVVGNVYLGRVKDVLPGMQAAFVDIGLEKNAFLYVDEVVDARGPRGPAAARHPAQLLKPGQQILVQVVKDPMGTKGARVTTDITLPGRFLVLMPFSEFVGVSRKLPDDERDRLHEIVARHRPRRTWASSRARPRPGASEKDLAERPRVPAAAVEARPAPGARGARARGRLHRDGSRAALRARRLLRGLPAAASSTTAARTTRSSRSSRRRRRSSCKRVAAVPRTRAAVRLRTTCSAQIDSAHAARRAAAVRRLHRDRPDRGAHRHRREHRALRRHARTSRTRSCARTSRRPTRSCGSCGCATSAGSSSSTSSTWRTSSTAPRCYAALQRGARARPHEDARDGDVAGSAWSR